ncbi:UrcA family protein [Phenylobacterium sp.]|uniref:UrcA family protein n=1 Tax=Phenylobacterium sp. TaxID=1871053 RepID=UPI002ED8BAE5
MPTRPLLILLAAAVTSHAQAATERHLIASVRVPLAALGVSAEPDAAQALGRIRGAAYLACGGDARRHPAFEEMPRHTVEVFRECREDALLGAVYGARAPALDSAHAMRAPDDR